ncbi:hypothetical protein ACFZBM_17440 [Streptomyces lavendulae]|uniref:Uncharacterized protein n=1 Tax=Streptomyces lavendulae subsp. lavendulae TaxID=58340 RepID=A0A2K8P840_STRLA|nr:hypothetical protein [Streptomyces lavendulae]ATZ22300.1 hypothetical protein SLAV_01880 [Streptomyces lavendulae subsp. lavendulae]
MDAFVDTFGDGYVEPALALGVETDRSPLAQVREAYTELERRHTHGKSVLRP